MKLFIGILLILFTNFSWASCSTLNQLQKVYIPCKNYEGEIAVKKAFTYEDPEDLVIKHNIEVADFDRAFFENKNKQEINKIISHLLPPSNKTDFLVIAIADNKISVRLESITKINNLSSLFLFLTLVAVVINGSLVTKKFNVKDNSKCLRINLSDDDIKKIWLTSPTISAIFIGSLISYVNHDNYGIIVGTLVGIFTSLFGYRLINKPIDTPMSLKAGTSGALVGGVMSYFSGLIFKQSGLLSIPFLEFLLIWLVLILVDLFSSKLTLEYENSF